MENGAWQDSSTLEMGTGTKNSSARYFICQNCGELHIVNEKTVGIVCQSCKKYVSIDKSYTQDELLEHFDEIKLPENSTHFVSETARIMIQHRDKWAGKAYDWKDKQLTKRNQPGFEPVYHGPIDEKTGKRTK